ncbi:MAG: VWA domain-containing protein [Candidatus Yanofskybacteria bacterium]|nr:VWA domain-containing protein [Candidatus Yanofskybacteria bacterium]
MDSIRQWFENLFFSEPTYFIFLNLLWVLIAVLVAVLTFKLIYRPKKSKYSRYRLFGEDTVWIAALAICALSTVALAGPKVSKGMKLTPGGNIDIGFLVDYSFSMKTDDIGDRSRLDIVKSVITNFIDSGTLKAGDRVTLFVFGTHSFWRMPFSEDFNILKSQLAEISHPQVYQDDSQLNTSLSNVVEHLSVAADKDELFESRARLLNMAWFKNNKVMFLFSDGGDNDDADLSRGLRELNKRNIKIYSAGVATREGKNITIEAYNPDGSNKSLQITVKTALQIQRLNEIATRTGGETYIIDSLAGITGAQSFLKNSVNTNRNFSPRLIASGESQDVWWELLSIPALVLLLIIIKKA